MLIGSCNGFFCIVDKDTLTIDNPSTRIHKRLPFSGFRFTDYAFGYDDSIDDYKVVGASLDNKAKIYSLKTGSWKHINDVPHISPWCHRGTFSNGAFHWMVRICKESMSSYRLTNIVSLDLSTETFGEVSPPVYDDEFDRSCTGVSLGALGEWLSVIVHYRGIRADLWVMKVYGMKDSWTKLVSIQYFTNVGVYRVPLSMSNDGKFLLTFYKKLVVYDSMNCSFNEIHDFDADFEARILVESLVSPLDAKQIEDMASQFTWMSGSESCSPSGFTRHVHDA
ncbi:F-box associated interaction domain-containing protein [Artemisia annua]|uniref:F-box associated interaction domain-containing protein n=1 Tax=Artemisia annua TaxID=35608 RepID=A0A2U1NQ65_ARTAN|nr:F-box associated interaction domain-containing protein [Artemisia annua]